MSRLDPTQRAALGYWWNLISDAARSGFTADQTMALAADTAKDLGGTVSFKESQAIAVLYGYVRREINTAAVFQAAGPDKFIDSDMISIPPYARDYAQQVVEPTYHVKFQYTYLDQAGNQQSTTKTSVFPNGLPQTVGELTQKVLDDAEAFASKYGHTLLSAIPLMILAV